MATAKKTAPAKEEKAQEKAAHAPIVIVARLKDQNHPGGQRITAFRRFGKGNSIAVVTPEEAAEIEADPYLFVEPRLSNGWLAAFGLPHTEEMMHEYKDKNPKIIEGNLAEVMALGKYPKEAIAQMEKDKADGKPVEDATERHNVLQQLMAAGLKPGKDFEGGAPLNALRALLP